MAPRSWSLDMYRRVPNDILESTKRGSIFSVVALVTMTVLFILETKEFFGSRLAPEMSLDTNDHPSIRIDFNITMMDMKCEYATIDIKSDLGTEQNITQHVNKFAINAEGVRQRYMSRNRHQTDIVMNDFTVKETIEELHEDGEDALQLDPKSIIFAKHAYDYVFVDYFASWCSHCRDLAPTWEVLAEVMNAAADEGIDEETMETKDDQMYKHEYINAKRLAIPALVGKLDCVKYRDFCQEENVQAYPTLRLYYGDDFVQYNGHRTVIEMVHWIAEVEQNNYRERKDRPKNHEEEEEDSEDSEDSGDQEDKNQEDKNQEDKNQEDKNQEDKNQEDKNQEEEEEEDVDKMEIAKRIVAKRQLTPEEKQWAENLERHRHFHRTTDSEWDDANHPGCQLSGFLEVDRSPGNFHIIARSKTHEFDPHLTNVSHEVHHLSFRDFETQVKVQNSQVPPGFVESLHAMNGNAYLTMNLHEAFHHYLKVITTNLGDGFVYKILPSSQLTLFPDDTVPEAKFAFDLSPISITYERKSRSWYDYITSLMAIVGGTFTVVGLLESGIHAASSKKNR